MREQVQQALEEYDPRLDGDDLEQAEDERAELLERFPLERWPTLALEDYAIGQPDSSETFCRWMEFKAVHLGSIKGGSAAKLIIYRRRNDGGWHYDEAAFDSVEDAWESVRADFVAAMRFAGEGDWAPIEDLGTLKSGQALLAKTLHVYFPDRVLPITSRAHLRHFLDLLEAGEEAPATLGSVALNRLLLRHLWEIDERQLSTNELERFLYRHFQPQGGATWVKIAPGRNAAFWDECLAGDFICVGWDEIGDLREFGGKAEFREEFARLYGDRYNRQPHIVAKKANELWRLMELRTHDRVVANRGKSRVLGVGAVKEPVYSFDPDRPEYKHLVHVDWDTSQAREIPSQGGWLNTIDKVTAAQRELIEGPAAEPAAAAGTVELEAEVEFDRLYPQLAEAIEAKGQAILYGPPGTGKTFHALRFARWWLARANREEPTDDELCFTSFHPSYAYEDFVEGYRPRAADGGGVELVLEDGTFKRVCRAAVERPGTTHLLVVDEINRANVAKVFGELLTLIERDKRGAVSVVLPQSRERFSVPPNLYLLGTMNTADRSVTMLDVAVRRRFAFLELMPDTELVEQEVGALKLADFLAGLNRRVADVAGREKQVGHAYLMPGGEVVAEPADFARVFWMEILPLLQEYCYEEYGQLEQILGGKIVDVADQALSRELREDPEGLIDALATRFTASTADDAGG